MHNIYKMIKSGKEWHATVDRRGFGTKQDFIPLFFLMHVQILRQGQKAVLAIVELEFFDIFYSQFQLVSTFSICSQFCVENWLLCCDVICKWVTRRSGCKRFWDSAHLLLISISIMYSSLWELYQDYTKKVWTRTDGVVCVFIFFSATKYITSNNIYVQVLL